jgi:O-antigen ligase
MKKVDFSLISVCFLAFAVNFGVALVSLATFFIFIFFIFNFKKLYFLTSLQLPYLKLFLIIIYLSISWYLLSYLWAVSSPTSFIKQLVNYSRVLLIPIILYSLSKEVDHFQIYKILVVSHLFVIFTSYLLWLKVPVFWETNFEAYSTFTPYTSSLEQPIISTVIFSIVWFNRNKFNDFWGSLTTFTCEFFLAANICFLMIGRSGILAFILLLTFIFFISLSYLWRHVALVFPFLFFQLIYFCSARVHSRFDAVLNQIIEYQNGQITSSQAIRLDFWYRSIQAFFERPIIGFGAGGWSNAYAKVLNGDLGVIGADNPHQQFLLWAVEGGSIGLMLLVLFYLLIFRISLYSASESSLLIRSVVLILFLVSFMNCPLHGAGLSEFFCLIIAVSLSKLNIDYSFTKNNFIH